MPMGHSLNRRELNPEFLLVLLLDPRETTAVLGPRGQPRILCRRKALLPALLVHQDQTAVLVGERDELRSTGTPAERQTWNDGRILPPADDLAFEQHRDDLHVCRGLRGYV